MKFVLKNRFIIGNSGSFYSFSYVELTLSYSSVKSIRTEPPNGAHQPQAKPVGWMRGLAHTVASLELGHRHVRQADSNTRFAYPAFQRNRMA
jgi:hypothetical protein